MASCFYEAAFLLDGTWQQHSPYFGSYLRKTLRKEDSRTVSESGTLERPTPNSHPALKLSNTEFITFLPKPAALPAVTLHAPFPLPRTMPCISLDLAHFALTWPPRPSETFLPASLIFTSWPTPCHTHLKLRPAPSARPSQEPVRTQRLPHNPPLSPCSASSHSASLRELSQGTVTLTGIHRHRGPSAARGALPTILCHIASDTTWLFPTRLELCRGHGNRPVCHFIFYQQI
ncbi:PREDICTED: uncharacterized protein LOC102027151 isoform X2 [Chinchilla lanigera]|nr:PREDICTED: uncharacterized protein LOC102027151 isoform X2 [Chinchilla lanigera]